jgi:hypothetical protein
MIRAEGFYWVFVAESRTWEVAAWEHGAWWLCGIGDSASPLVTKVGEKIHPPRRHP